MVHPLLSAQSLLYFLSPLKLGVYYETPSLGYTVQYIIVSCSGEFFSVSEPDFIMKLFLGQTLTHKKPRLRDDSCPEATFLVRQNVTSPGKMQSFSMMKTGFIPGSDLTKRSPLM